MSLGVFDYCNQTERQTLVPNSIPFLIPLFHMNLAWHGCLLLVKETILSIGLYELQFEIYITNLYISTYIFFCFNTRNMSELYLLYILSFYLTFHHIKM